MTNAEAQEELWAIIEQNPDKPEVYWPFVVEFVAGWIVNRPGLLPVQPEDLAHLWHEAQA